MAVLVITRPRNADRSEQEPPPEPYKVPANACLLIESTSGLPSGWQVQAMTNKLLRYGTASTGGDTTHTHTRGSSSGGAHTHVISFNESTGVSAGLASIADSGGQPVDAAANHTHGVNGSITTSSNGAHDHGNTTTGTASNFPPYRGKYVIKNISGMEKEIPSGGIIMSPGNLSKKVISGFSTVTELTGKYIMGNTTSSGGSLTHGHTVGGLGTAGAHTHSISIISSMLSGPSHETTGEFISATTSVATTEHGHSYSGNTGSAGGHSHTIGNATACGNIYPKRVNMFFYKKNSDTGVGELPSGIAILWPSSTATPSGWSTLSSTAVGGYLYGVDTVSSIYTAASYSGHTHTFGAVSTGPNHSHGGANITSSGPTATTYCKSGSYSYAANSGHTHSISVPSTDNNGSHTHTIDSESAKSLTPAYQDFKIIVKD